MAADSPQKSQQKRRRRTLSGLLSSSSTLTLTLTSSHKHDHDPHGYARDGESDYDYDHHGGSRPHRSLRNKGNNAAAAPSKLQKRSRPHSSSGGSLFGMVGSGGGTDISSSTMPMAMEDNNRTARNSYYHYNNHSDLPPPSRLPSGSHNPSLFEQQQQQQQPRPRSKTSGRNSMFGSLRSLGSTETEDRLSTWTTSKTTAASTDDDSDFFMALGGGLGGGGGGFQVLHYGTVQMTTGGSMWRRKRQFLVLTDSHLARFKNQAKAAEALPAIPPSHGRNSTMSMASKRQSAASMASSIHDGSGHHHLVGHNGEPIANNIPLSNIVAVRSVHDPKSPADTHAHAIEVCYIADPTAVKASFLQIHVSDRQEFELWLGGIRGAAVRLNSPDPSAVFDRASIDYVVRALEQERDYDADSFRMFKVAQRIPVKRQSSDDPAKHAPPNLCFLALGMHKIHVVPFPKPDRSSMVSLNSGVDLSLCLGVMCLTALSMQHGEDDFQMSFRIPLRSHFPIYLSSIFCAEIALVIWQRAEFLRPQWLLQPFIFNVSREVDNRITPNSRTHLNDGSFDRTLVAYCSSYGLNASKIRYTIDYECEDAPRFQLLRPPGSKNGSGYSALELIAVMRALRYNETFLTISFSGVKLDVLSNLRDPHEMDYDAMKSRAHASLHIPGQESLPILSQEIRALALKSSQLKRLDFSFCLNKHPALERAQDDPGCGIPEAIFPLCRRQLTNVDWIVLNGIKLVDADLDYLVDAASQKLAHLRALEISHCDISIHNFNLLLSTLAAQEETLEAINISGVQGRLSPELFQQQIGYFAHIRKINLSHISTGMEPLIGPETLLNWRLEELCLSHMTVHEGTVESIVAYLASPQSDRLRELRLDQCGLTGRDVARLLSAMGIDEEEGDREGRSRDIHLHVSENRLYTHFSEMVDAIARNKTPTHLTMRMVEFKKEDHFRDLVDALRVNTVLKSLDISKASLPYDAGQETSRALQQMFEENTTLQELDISGEYAHLEVARFGIGLNLALTGLKKNSTLKVLKIEHQKLGLQGANTLASVLEENNALVEVHCDNNEINLQSLTVLLNGLQRNRSVLYLPCMDRDRQLSLDRVRREIEAVNETQAPGGGKWASYSSSSPKGSSLRRTLQSAASGIGMRSVSGNKLTKSASQQQKQKHPAAAQRENGGPTAPGDMSAAIAPEARIAMRGLTKRWDEQVERLQRYLYRNYRLANGEISDDLAANGGDNHNGPWDGASDGRPATAASLGTVLRQMALEPEDDASLASSAQPPPPGTDSADHGGEEDRGLFMKTVSKMPSFHTIKDKNNHANGGTTTSSTTTTGNINRANSNRKDAARTIDLGHELAPSSPPPQQAPSFLRPENRGASESSVPTSTKSTNSIARKAGPMWRKRTEKHAGADADGPGTAGGGGGGGDLRSAKSSITITAAPISNGDSANNNNTGDTHADGIHTSNKDAGKGPGGKNHTAAAAGGGRPASPFRALSFGLEEKLSKKKKQKKSQKQTPQQQQPQQQPQPQPQQQEARGEIDQRRSEGDTAVSDADAGSDTTPTPTPTPTTRDGNKTPPRLEWTLPDVKLF